MEKFNKKAVFAYVPILHAGYKHFFDTHNDANSFILVGNILKKELDYLRKDIRALPVDDIQTALASWYQKKDIFIENDINLPSLEGIEKIVAPDEDITRKLLKDIPDNSIQYEKIFLRWNRDNIGEKREGVHMEIEAGELEEKMFSKANEEMNKVSEWWRKVGAVVARDGKILLSGANRYGQSPHIVWSEGDPRDASHKGEDIEISTSLHAERGIISEAARQGISLDGADMYVTTYPCPMCAKMIAASGIKRLFYNEGYVVLDGEKALKRADIDIRKVTGITAPDEDEYLPYPKKTT